MAPFLQFSFPSRFPFDRTSFSVPHPVRGLSEKLLISVLFAKILSYVGRYSLVFPDIRLISNRLIR